MHGQQSYVPNKITSLTPFYNNEKAPEEQKIKNMDWAGMGLAMATEYLLADYALRFNHVVPLITFEGEKYLVLQMADWHVGMPFVNWLAPVLVREQNGVKKELGDAILMNNQTREIRRITPDYKNRASLSLTFGLMYNVRNPRELMFADDNAYIMNFQQDKYDQLVELYNQFVSLR